MNFTQETNQNKHGESRVTITVTHDFSPVFLRSIADRTEEEALEFYEDKEFIELDREEIEKHLYKAINKSIDCIDFGVYGVDISVVGLAKASTLAQAAELTRNVTLEISADISFTLSDSMINKIAKQLFTSSDNQLNAYRVVIW